MPTPNSCCQNRLTATRAVNGCSGDTNHSAKSMRVFGPSFLLHRRQEGRRIALDLLPGIVVRAANQDVGGPPVGFLFHDHRHGDRGLERSVFSAWAFSRACFACFNSASSVFFCVLRRRPRSTRCSICLNLCSVSFVDPAVQLREPRLLRFACQADVRRLQPSLEVRSLPASGFRCAVQVVEEGKQLVEVPAS